MTRKEIRINLYSILDTLVGGYIEITDDSDLEGDLGIDSIDKAEILLEIEKTFGLIVPAEDAKTLRTVRDIINYISLYVDVPDNQQC